MNTVTARKLDPRVKEHLHLHAAVHGHSVQQETRQIHSAACGPSSRVDNLANLASRFFQAELGVELDLPAHREAREPPRFN